MKSLNSSPSVFTPFLRRFTDESARDLTETIALYHDVHHSHVQSPWAQQDIIDRLNGAVVEVVEKLTELPQYLPLGTAMDRCQKAILARETTIVDFPKIDWPRAHLSMKEQVDLRRFLRAKQHFLANQDRVFQNLAGTLATTMAGIIKLLPDLPADDQPSLTIPLISVIPDPHDLIDKIINTFTTEDVLNDGLFTYLQDRFYENVCRASGVQPYVDTKRPLISPADSELNADELIDTYLAGTPFLDLFKTPIPFVLPQNTRFEHHWIVAGTGHGKTNTLSQLILDDLQRVADGEASIVVIDSQNALIPAFAGSKLFAKGQPLEDKLLLIDPNDIEYPVALNLFDLGLQRLGTYSLLDRERMLNTAAEVMQFILASLLGAEMTSRQSTLFGFTLQAMQLIPDATIHTFRQLMEPNGSKKFAAHLTKLEGRAREFFETQFDAPIFSKTKQEVVARLFAISENRTFDRMLSNPRSKLDVFTEINAGKVILINTAKDLLKQQGTEIFGRFFLALIAQAAQERATLAPSRRLPCFVYIDECQDYLSSDSNFTVILEQARKQNVAIIAAHQYLTQLSQKTLDALYANTSIKFAGGVSDKDAYALARNMRCEPAFIAEQPKGSFAAYVKGSTKSAMTLKFPFLDFATTRRMTSAEQQDIRNALRAKYATHISHLSSAPPQPPSPQPAAPANPPPTPPAEPDIHPSKPAKWPL
ncbi:MAG: ATP-binding protein [Alphaproteobacteria bacterium]|nr:ATP-binding protein [Alphaproteobacteria bacterium]